MIRTAETEKYFVEQQQPWENCDRETGSDVVKSPDEVGSGTSAAVE